MNLDIMTKKQYADYVSGKHSHTHKKGNLLGDLSTTHFSTHNDSFEKYYGLQIGVPTPQMCHGCLERFNDLFCYDTRTRYCFTYHDKECYDKHWNLNKSLQEAERILEKWKNFQRSRR